MAESESPLARPTAVYVAKDGQPTGPFSIDQLKSMAAQGAVSGSDLAWHEGASGWISLTELLSGDSQAPIVPPAPPKASRPGLVGSIIAFAAMPLWLCILVVAGVSQASNPGSQSALLLFVGLSVFILLGANVTGAVLGSLAITRKSERRRLTIIGLALNLIQIAGILLLMVIGFSVK